MFLKVLNHQCTEELKFRLWPDSITLLDPLWLLVAQVADLFAGVSTVGQQWLPPLLRLLISRPGLCLGQQWALIEDGGK